MEFEKNVTSTHDATKSSSQTQVVESVLSLEQNVPTTKQGTFVKFRLFASR
jgi:hypothetical protein